MDERMATLEDAGLHGLPRYESLPDQGQEDTDNLPQTSQQGITSTSLEYTVPMNKKLAALSGYFLCNIGLTLYNKALLGKFHSPWLLTALHAGCSFIGCLFLLLRGHFRLTKLSAVDDLALMAFSVLFTVNIAISNVSLEMVSIPFHQVVRSTTPVFTTILYSGIFGRYYALKTYLSLVPLIVGVAIATYGDYTYTKAGFLMTFVGVILAALKTIITNKMMTGKLALRPLELLMRMSLVACIQALCVAAFTGEVSLFMRKLLPQLSEGAATIAAPPDSEWISWTTMVLLGNGALAFVLNISSFTTNKIAGALTMTVCANIKQCLTIVLGMVFFDAAANLLTVTGIGVTLAGGAFYSLTELRAKAQSKA